jgi:uncharacterized protein involved in exopolysaccharide biosynthesis
LVSYPSRAPDSNNLSVANGEHMKNTFVLFAIVSGALLTSGHAATKAGYETAKVVSVESRATPSNVTGDNPSDAPLQPEVYSYDIAILLGGTVYQAHYDSAFDEPPSVIAPNHSIQVNLKKHTMDVDLPDDRTLQMSIESRTGLASATRWSSQSVGPDLR